MISQSHDLQEERRGQQAPELLIVAQDLAYACQRPTGVPQVALDVGSSQGLDHDRASQREPGLQRLVLGSPTADHKREQAVVRVEVTDGAHAGATMLGRHFVETVEERGNLIGGYPHVPEPTWHAIAFVEFIDQPGSQRSLLHRPRREMKDHRDGSVKHQPCFVEQLVRQFHQQSSLARPGLAEDQQLPAKLPVDVRDGLTRRQEEIGLLRPAKNGPQWVVHRSWAFYKVEGDPGTFVQRSPELRLYPFPAHLLHNIAARSVCEFSSPILVLLVLLIEERLGPP
jgi:hypothetical protein